MIYTKTVFYCTTFNGTCHPAGFFEVIFQNESLHVDFEQQKSLRISSNGTMSRLQAFLQSCHDFVYETDERLASQDSIRIYRWSFSWMLDSTSPKKAFKDIFLPNIFNLKVYLLSWMTFVQKKQEKNIKCVAFPIRNIFYFLDPPGQVNRQPFWHLHLIITSIFIPFHILRASNVEDLKRLVKAIPSNGRF